MSSASIGKKIKFFVETNFICYFRIMNEQELAKLLISKGFFNLDEFSGHNLRAILINRGVIGPDEPRNGESLEQCLRSRGLV